MVLTHINFIKGPLMEKHTLISLKLSGAAKQLLPPDSPPRLVSPLLNTHIPAPGDHMRVASIPNCPWLVVTRRNWDLSGEQEQLVIWLDVIGD